MSMDSNSMGVNPIADFLRLPSKKLSLSALLNAHARLSMTQIMKGNVSYEDILQTLKLTLDGKTDEMGEKLETYVDAYGALLWSSILVPSFSASSMHKPLLVMKADLVGNEPAFIHALLKVLKETWGETFNAVIAAFEKDAASFFPTNVEASNYDITPATHTPTEAALEQVIVVDSCLSEKSPVIRSIETSPTAVQLSSPALPLLENNELPSKAEDNSLIGNALSEDSEFDLENSESAGDGTTTIETNSRHDPVAQFLSQIRRYGMVILLPQTLHDQILISFYVILRLLDRPMAHRDLTQIILDVKDSGHIPDLQSLSATKIRGVLQLLKQSGVIAAKVNGDSTRLSLAKDISHFVQLRQRHDNFLLTYMVKHHVYVPDEYKNELVWEFNDKVLYVQYIEGLERRIAELMVSFEYIQQKYPNSTVLSGSLNATSPVHGSSPTAAAAAGGATAPLTAPNTSSLIYGLAALNLNKSMNHPGSSLYDPTPLSAATGIMLAPAPHGLPTSAAAVPSPAVRATTINTSSIPYGTLPTTHSHAAQASAHPNVLAHGSSAPLPTASSTTYGTSGLPYGTGPISMGSTTTTSNYKPNIISSLNIPYGTLPPSSTVAPSSLPYRMSNMHSHSQHHVGMLSAHGSGSTGLHGGVNGYRPTTTTVYYPQNQRHQQHHSSAYHPHAPAHTHTAAYDPYYPSQHGTTSVAAPAARSYQHHHQAPAHHHRPVTTSYDRYGQLVYDPAAPVEASNGYGAYYPPTEHHYPAHHDPYALPTTTTAATATSLYDYDRTRAYAGEYSVEPSASSATAVPLTYEDAYHQAAYPNEHLSPYSTALATASVSSSTLPPRPPTTTVMSTSSYYPYDTPYSMPKSTPSPPPLNVPSNGSVALGSSPSTVNNTAPPALSAYYASDASSFTLPPASLA